MNNLIAIRVKKLGNHKEYKICEQSISAIGQEQYITLGFVKANNKNDAIEKFREIEYNREMNELYSNR